MLLWFRIQFYSLVTRALTRLRHIMYIQYIHKLRPECFIDLSLNDYERKTSRLCGKSRARHPERSHLQHCKVTAASSSHGAVTASGGLAERAVMAAGSHAPDCGQASPAAPDPAADSNTE